MKDSRAEKPKEKASTSCFKQSEFSEKARKKKKKKWQRDRKKKKEDKDFALAIGVNATNTSGKKKKKSKDLSGIVCYNCKMNSQYANKYPNPNN